MPTVHLIKTESGDVILAKSSFRKFFHYFNHIYCSHFSQNNCSVNFSTPEKRISFLHSKHWTFQSGDNILAESRCQNIFHYFKHTYMVVIFVKIFVNANFFKLFYHYFNHIYFSNSCQNNCKGKLLFCASEHPVITRDMRRLCREMLF